MEKSFREVRRVMHPLKFRLLSVKRVQQVSPRLKRVTLTGEDLAGFVSSSPDDHVKVFFPRPGEDLPVVPSLGPEGPVIPEGAIMRDYTPLRFDSEKLELDLEFVLHDFGPGAIWAKNAREGSVLGVGGPRGSMLVPYEFDWYLLIGDDVAMPSFSRRLKELPAGVKVLAFLEVATTDEERDFVTDADVELFWLPRNGRPAGSTTLLRDAVLKAVFPYGDYFAWVSGESQSVKEIKELLETVKGADPTWIKATSYWKKD